MDMRRIADTLAVQHPGGRVRHALRRARRHDQPYPPLAAARRAAGGAARMPSRRCRSRAPAIDDTQGRRETHNSVAHFRLAG